MKFFWTETKGSRQNKQDIFHKRCWQQRETAKCFLKILHEKQIFKKNCSKKKREKNKEFLKMKQENQRYFCNFPKTERQFFKRPKKKIDKRKSRTVNFKQKKTNKSEKHGTHKATARRKEEKTRDLPQIKALFQ